jgi:hypothetical protein
MTEEELVAVARKHSLGGLQFDRKGLLAFVKEIKQKPLRKEVVRRLFSHGVPPSAEFWYAYARAVEKAHGITEE